MRSLAVIKVDILVYSRSEFFFRAIFVSIQFFALHGSEERFHHRIVIRHSGFREELCDIPLCQIYTESSGTVVAALVGMENQIFSHISGFVCIFECAFYQLRAVIFANPVCDHLSRKEIHNHTDIELHFIQFEVSNIADPDLIRLVHIKLAIDYILCFSVLIHILLLSALSNAFYPHFSHQLP